jgi:Trehalose and maltose hydrolases (possible phosphorylases)
MKFCVDTKKNNSWYLGTKQYDSKNANKIESIMFQGNGYFGMRAATEERQLHEKRNMFVSGTFDAFADEVTELPNLPDLLNMEIKVDGQTFCLKDGKVKNYHKYLNMQNGELIRKFDWIINHKRVSFKFSRFCFNG